MNFSYLKSHTEKDGIFDEIEKAKRGYYWIKYAESANVLKDRKLIVGKCYGTRGQSIFDDCCDVFGWDKSERGNFGQQKLMYSPKAANGIGIGFLPNHHFNSPDDGSRSWYNVISPNAIYEFWNIERTELFRDNEKRVLFVRTPKGYVYLGIFEISRSIYNQTNPYDGKTRDIKVFKKIQGDYEGSFNF